MDSAELGDAFRVALARELHDTVAQTLSASAMRAPLALADPGLPAEPRTDLEWIADQCRSSAHDLRELMGRLRGDAVVTDQPLASLDTLRQTVAEQVDRLRSAGYEASGRVSLTRLSAARSQALSAVTVEAVNNMIKHATPGSTCLIELRDDGTDVLVSHANGAQAGRGSADEPGMGLTGVRERLVLLGGTSGHRREGQQWVLAARLPHGVEAGS
ncbi:sensor histidine kinase [Micropruina sp.]|uniref:sensor histidine kinase n=1 Tax=Micropruina sp. TaxID=2737536 RepID=UPI0039E35BB2